MKTKSKYKFSPFQKAWINALISQKYNKTIGQLARIDKKGNLSCCCLGVACEIAPKFLGSIPEGHKVDSNYIEYNGYTKGLPKNVVDALCLNGSRGSVKLLFGAFIKNTTLAQLNDEAQWDHKKIGEYIRDNPENVFCNTGKET